MALGLHTSDADTTQTLCIATVFSSDSKPERCTRVLPPSDVNTINRILTDMTLYMPDQVDHIILDNLAKACLCTADPSPHRGSQEAAVIYRWTEMLSAEACLLRASVQSLPPSPAPPTLKSRRTKASPNPWLVKNLTIRVEPREPVFTFPTPTAMTPEEAYGFDPREVPSVTSAMPIPPRRSAPASNAGCTTAHKRNYELPPTPPDTATWVFSPPSSRHTRNASTSKSPKSPTSFSAFGSGSPGESITATRLSSPSPNQPLSLQLTSPQSRERFYSDSPRYNRDIDMVTILAESQTQMKELLSQMAALKGEMSGLKEEVVQLRGELALAKGLASHDRKREAGNDEMRVEYEEGLRQEVTSSVKGGRDRWFRSW